jgi:hypothetical protein
MQHRTVRLGFATGETRILFPYRKERNEFYRYTPKSA